MWEQKVNSTGKDGMSGTRSGTREHPAPDVGDQMEQGAPVLGEQGTQAGMEVRVGQ